MGRLSDSALRLLLGRPHRPAKAGKALRPAEGAADGPGRATGRPSPPPAIRALSRAATPDRRASPARVMAIRRTASPHIGMPLGNRGSGTECEYVCEYVCQK